MASKVQYRAFLSFYFRKWSGIRESISDGHHYLVPLSINYPLMSPIIH